MGFFGGMAEGFASSKGGQKLLGKLGNFVKKPFKKKAPESTAPTPGVPTSAEGSPFVMKRGGKVRKTGLIKMHKGERVLTKRQTRRYESRKGRSRGRAKRR